MFDLDTLCPHCERKFKLNMIGPKATEFIRCPHCRKIIKLDPAGPEKRATRVGPDLVD